MFDSRLGPDMNGVNKWSPELGRLRRLRIRGEGSTASYFDHPFAGVMGVKFVHGQVLQWGLGDGREE